MNNLEELLRSDLYRATELIDPEPDITGVLVGGRRARRAQVARRTIGGTAGVLAVVLLAWAGLAPRVVSGVPEPAQTASATPSTGSSSTVTVDLTEGYTMNGVEPPYSRLEVTATRVSGGYDVSFVAIDANGKPTASEGSVADGRILIHEYRRMVVGLLADQLTWRHSVYQKMAGGVTSQEIPWAGPGPTILVDVSEKSGSSIAGMLWEGADGIVRDDRGEEVSCAQVGVAKGPGLVCVDERLDTLLYRGAGGENVLSNKLSSETGIVRIKSWMSIGAEHSATAIGLLPKGASNPAVTLGAAGLEWASAELSGSGRVVFVAVGEPAEDDRSPLVTEVSYTDAEGKRVVDRNP